MKKIDIKGHIHESSYRTCVDQTNGGKVRRYLRVGRVGGIRIERRLLLNFLERSVMFLK